MYQLPLCVQLADELKKYGLTLTNYASIREQSVGGFIQVWVASLAAQRALKLRLPPECAFSSKPAITGRVLPLEATYIHAVCCLTLPLLRACGFTVEAPLPECPCRTSASQIWLTGLFQ